jgi:four helix bundle protein
MLCHLRIVEKGGVLMRDCGKYKVWEMSMKLAEDVYFVTSSFPRTEVFGLQSQLRRANVSIANNIAEGADRDRPLDFARMLGTSLGSANEVESMLEPSKRLGFSGAEVIDPLVERIQEVKRILVSLILRLSPRKNPPSIRRAPKHAMAIAQAIAPLLPPYPFRT